MLFAVWTKCAMIIAIPIPVPIHCIYIVLYSTVEHLVILQFFLSILNSGSNDRWEFIERANVLMYTVYYTFICTTKCIHESYTYQTLLPHMSAALINLLYLVCLASCVFALFNCSTSRCLTSESQRLHIYIFHIIQWQYKIKKNIL